MTKKTALTIAAVVVLVPLLLWLDVWLGIKFGNWLESLGGELGGPVEMGGVCAWMVLVAAQVVAIAMYAYSKENN